MGTLDRHPAFAAVPPGAGDTDRLWISINDDDPLTFATCLRDEYAQMHATLIRQGVSQDDAIDWLDRARVCGLRSRFTLAGANGQAVAAANPTQGDGCQYDTQCKGDRVCMKGACVDPIAPPAAAAPAPAGQEPTPAAPAQ